MAINLISSQEVENRRIAKWRRFGLIGTSVVLVAYMAAVGGAFWMWLSTSGQQTELASEIEQVSLRLNQLADVEATIAAARLRAQAADNYLNTRKSSVAEPAKVRSALVVGLGIAKWDYKSNGETMVTVTTTNPAAIEEFVKNLAGGKYAGVTLKAMTLENDTWEARISLK